MLARVLRAVLRMPPPSITPEEAVSIAQAEWERQGFEARPRVEEHLKEYVVWMYRDVVGGNQAVYVDIYSGVITRVKTLPR
jgi:hypothetical protein